MQFKFVQNCRELHTLYLVLLWANCANTLYFVVSISNTLYTFFPNFQFSLCHVPYKCVGPVTKDKSKQVKEKNKRDKTYFFISAFEMLAHHRRSMCILTSFP